MFLRRSYLTRYPERDPVTPYEKFEKNRDDILKALQIDSTNTDVIEEVFLKCVGIEDEPDECRYGGYWNSSHLRYKFEDKDEEEEFVVLSYIIPEDARALPVISAITARFPRLEATDFTEQFIQQQQNLGNKKLDVAMMRRIFKIIRMRAQAFSEDYLPLIAPYLEKDQARLEKYQLLSYGDLKELPTCLSKQSIYLSSKSEAGTLGNILLDMLKENSQKARVISQALNETREFPAVLEDMICDYLNINKEFTPSPEMKEVWSQFDMGTYGFSHSFLYIDGPLLLARQLANYFNKIFPQSAIIKSRKELIPGEENLEMLRELPKISIADEENVDLMNELPHVFEEEKQEEEKKVKEFPYQFKVFIKNKTLDNPGFISILEDKFNLFTRMKQEHNREYCLSWLSTISHCLFPEGPTKVASQQLNAAIENLISYAKQTGITDSPEIIKLVDNAQQCKEMFMENAKSLSIKRFNFFNHDQEKLKRDKYISEVDECLSLLRKNMMTIPKINKRPVLRAPMSASASSFSL